MKKNFWRLTTFEWNFDFERWPYILFTDFIDFTRSSCSRFINYKWKKYPGYVRVKNSLDKNITGKKVYYFK